MQSTDQDTFVYPSPQPAAAGEISSTFLSKVVKELNINENIAKKAINLFFFMIINFELLIIFVLNSEDYNK